MPLESLHFKLGVRNTLYESIPETTETMKTNTDKFGPHKNVKILQNKPHQNIKGQRANLENVLRRELVCFKGAEHRHWS